MSGHEVQSELYNEDTLSLLKGYKAVVDTGCFKFATCSEDDFVEDSLKLEAGQ